MESANFHTYNRQNQIDKTLQSISLLGLHQLNSTDIYTIRNTKQKFDYAPLILNISNFQLPAQLIERRFIK